MGQGEDRGVGEREGSVDEVGEAGCGESGAKGYGEGGEIVWGGGGVRERCEVNYGERKG